MEILRSMGMMFGRSGWVFCVEDWPLYPKTAHYSSGPYVTICKSLDFLFPCVYLHLQFKYVCRDPQRLRTDAELMSSLQRSWLLPKGGTPDPAAEAKFSLESIVGDDGY